jgi:catechol 2,3-dioxygenase-like lactoylglutathione lyase family enzyme
VLKDSTAFSSFSTDDLQKAQEFYGETLGLEVTKEEMGVLTLHLAKGAQAMIYPKPNHTPATFTVLNFVVDDIEQEVDGLIQKGVEFERYDNEYMKTDEKGIAGQGNGRSMAWFKDPAGNIIGLLQTK